MIDDGKGASKGRLASSIPLEGTREREAVHTTGYAFAGEGTRVDARAAPLRVFQASNPSLFVLGIAMGHGWIGCVGHPLMHSVRCNALLAPTCLFFFLSFFLFFFI